MSYDKNRKRKSYLPKIVKPYIPGGIPGDEITILSGTSVDTGASYLLTATTASLPNGKLFQVDGTTIILETPSTYKINNSVIATISGTTYSGPVVIDAANTLSVGSGSFQISSNEVSWGSNNKIFLNGSDLVFKDDNNTQGWTLSQLAQSGSIAADVPLVQNILNYSTASYAVPITITGTLQRVYGLQTIITSSGYPILYLASSCINGPGPTAPGSVTVLRNDIDLGHSTYGLNLINTRFDENIFINVGFIDYPPAGINVYDFTVSRSTVNMILNEVGTVSKVVAFELNESNLFNHENYAAIDNKFLTYSGSINGLNNNNILNALHGLTSTIGSTNGSNITIAVTSSINTLTSSISGTSGGLYLYNSGSIIKQVPQSLFYIKEVVTSSFTTTSTPQLAFQYTFASGTSNVATNFAVTACSTTTNKSGVWKYFADYYLDGLFVNKVGSITEITASQNSTLGFSITSSLNSIVGYVTGVNSETINWGIIARVQSTN